MRQRWASSENDVGWASRPSDSGSRGRSQNGGSADAQIQRRFIARETIIDCPHPGCRGIYLTGRREIHRPPGTGARVVLKCTRRPSDHETTLFMPPYGTEEREALKTALQKNEPLRCVRCGTAMQLGKVSAPGARGTRVEGAATYYCSWCGVKWVPSSDVQPSVP